MKDSTRRALRTALHVLIAVAAAIPAVAANLPSWEVLGQIVVVAGGISKAVNMAEESGLLPSWLKGGDTPAVVADAVAEAPTVAADATKVGQDVAQVVEGDAAP